MLGVAFCRRAGSRTQKAAQKAARTKDRDFSFAGTGPTGEELQTQFRYLISDEYDVGNSLASMKFAECARNFRRRQIPVPVRTFRTQKAARKRRLQDQAICLDLAVTVAKLNCIGKCFGWFALHKIRLGQDHSRKRPPAGCGRAGVLNRTEP